MSIKRMLLLASMAVTAIAFAAPAAQATVRLTDPNGTVLQKNDLVTVTSSSLTTTTANGTLECGLVTLHYKVQVPGPNHVVLNPVVSGTHNGTTQNCNLNTGMGLLPAHITNAGTGQLTINTWGTGDAGATFTSTITTPAGDLHCTFTGKVSFQGVAPETDEVEIETPAVLTGAPSPPCPPTGEMHGKLTLETSNGTPIFLDFVKTG